VAVLAGYQSVAAVFVASLALELVRSFSNLYLPNTWQLVLGVFLLGVILFLPRGIGSLWVRDRHKKEDLHGGAAPGRERGCPVKPVLSVRGWISALAQWSRRRSLHRYRGRPEGQPDRRQRRGQNNLRQHVTGYLKPDSGSIALDGIGYRKALATTCCAARIFQVVSDSTIVHELTAAENLAVAVSGMRTQALSFHSPAEAKGAATRRSSCWNGLGLPISQTADLGTRRRRAQACRHCDGAGRRPKLLLLDEPTSGVSAEEKFATMDRVIHAVAPDAATIVFVEHDMENRQPLCRPGGGVLPGRISPMAIRAMF